MSKLKSIDKQLEDMSMKWYIKEYYGDQIRANNTKEFRRQVLDEIDSSTTRKDIIKEYLNTHPKVKQQYTQKKKTMNRIKVGLGLGLVTVAVGIGAHVYSNKTKEQPTINEQIEYTLYQEPEIEENEYEKFFKEARNIENTNRRDEEIVKYTKERIVEAYNIKNPDNQITADRLQYLHLDEDVIVNTDSLGYDVSYERTPQIGQYIETENKVLKKISGGIYEFKIDGKTVAVYNGQGDEVIDSSIENKEEFFKDTIGLLEATEKLQGAYKYRNSEYDISRLEDNYETTARKLIEEKEIEEKNNENIR